MALREIVNEGVEIRFDLKFWSKNLILVSILGVIFYFFVLRNLVSFESRLKDFAVLLVVGILYGLVILLWNWEEVKLFVKEVRKI